MKHYFLIILLFSSTAIFAQHTLTVDVTNLRNTSGALYFSLFKSETGFPDKYENAIHKGKIYPIKSNTVTYVFTNLPAGTYAVAVFHDENNDTEMKTNFMGIPLEGTAVSNNAKGKFGPPKYADAQLFIGENKKISIKMWYF